MKKLLVFLMMAVMACSMMLAGCGGDKKEAKKAEKIYLATRLAVSSGMRQGEILALRKENIDTSPEGDIAIITVEEAIAKKAVFNHFTSGKDSTQYILYQ